MTVAALYVQTGGAYYGIEGVEPWDQKRDATEYAGPHPVIAHPPCARWSKLAHVVQARWGHKVGDDGGLFAAALASVKEWGGVLEHPAETLAWPTFGLQRPPKMGWQRDMAGGWTCEVSQRNYGHRAQKMTWLYYVGAAPPPLLDWRTPPPARLQISNLTNHGGKLEWLPKAERARTPDAFRDVLITLARGARVENH